MLRQNKVRAHNNLQANSCEELVTMLRQNKVGAHNNLKANSWEELVTMLRQNKVRDKTRAPMFRFPKEKY